MNEPLHIRLGVSRVADQMSEFKATANAHMRRDMEADGSWSCTCEACQNIRSLVGMEKMLDVWPLVRQLLDTKDRMDAQPDGAEKQALLERYLQLHDQLADEMAK